MIPHPSTVVTPELRALRSGSSPESVSPVWPVVGAGFPLPDDASSGREGTAPTVPVTFAVRAPAGQEVLVHLNGLVDRSRTEFEWALLPQVFTQPGGEAVYAQAYELPAGLHCSYRIAVRQYFQRDLGQTRPGWKSVHEDGRPDPLNPGTTIPTPLGGDASLLCLPGALTHPAWEPGPSGLGTTTAGAAVGHGDCPREEKVGDGVAFVDTGSRAGLAVVFDAEQWRDVGLLEALARMGESAPALLLVDSDVPGSRDRAGFLPEPSEVSALVTPILRQLRDDVFGTWGLPRTRILATGQSFGGLASVGAVALSGWAGTALAQSASLHYRPGGARPLHAQGLGALMDAIVEAGPAKEPGVIDLIAGTEEAGLLPVARQAGDILTGLGYKVSVRSAVGGHDYAWWRHELFTTLGRMGR